MANKKSLFRSINGLFLLFMAIFVVILSGPLFLAGSKIMDHTIRQYGTEILLQHLAALIKPLDDRYERLKRFGLEDSETHQKEIYQKGLKELDSFRYQLTGRVFIIKNDKTVVLSENFGGNGTSDVQSFLEKIDASPTGTLLEYSAGGKQKNAVCRFYEPWKSYVGITIDKDELFSSRNLFLKINYLVILGALFFALVFMFVLHKLLIAPLIELTEFASQVRKGGCKVNLQRRYIWELFDLKNDITSMVNSLQEKMEETSAQLTLIKKREHELSEAMGQLQASETRYREIYNAPSDAIFIHAADSGEILDVNKGMTEMYGFSHDEALEAGIGQMMSGEYPYTIEEAGNKIRAVIENGPQTFEWRCKRKNGELFWGEVALKHISFSGSNYLIAVVRDVDVRKKAEKDLAAEKERLAVTLRSIGDGVITTDISGNIVLINKVTEELTGWNQEEAVGKPLEEVFWIVNEQTREVCENPVKKVMSSGQIVGLANHTILIAKDGTERSIADSGAPILDSESNIIGVVLVFRDNTEQIRMEKEQLKIKKLESIGVLAGGIAHDFNNILAAILGNINLALFDNNLKEETKKLLSEAERASIRAKDLTMQLLTFSKGGEPVKEVAALDSVIIDSANFVLHGDKVACHFEIPDDLWLVNIDRGQISQVVQNIVLNASHAMPQGGSINVICENIPSTGVLNGQSIPEGKFVKICIRDKGHGMPANVVDKIFDPYFSTKQEGSGLGLAITHSIINKHGGHIWVESSPGEGTAFTLLLPASEETKVISEKPKKQIKNSIRKAKILIMDDDEMVRTVAKAMLGELGYEVELSECGETAIQLYQKALAENHKFDLVIMDLTVPGGMGGREAAEEILKGDPEAKVVVSSGYSNDPIMANFNDYGFCSAIVKPYQLQELSRTINEVLG